MYKLSQNSINKLDKIHPKLVMSIQKAITNSPFDFIIIQGFRTAEYQNGLYKQGRTAPGIRVTNCDGYVKKSNHQAKADGYGHAIDIFVCGIVENGHYRKFTTAEGYDSKKMFAVVKHIKEVAQKLGIPVKWGGDWKKDKDYPHFEI